MEGARVGWGGRLWRDDGPAGPGGLLTGVATASVRSRKTPPPRPNTPRVVKEGATLGGARDHGLPGPQDRAGLGHRETGSHVLLPDGSRRSAVKRSSAGQAFTCLPGIARSEECSCRVCRLQMLGRRIFPTARRTEAPHRGAGSRKVEGETGRSSRVVTGRGSLPRRSSVTRGSNRGGWQGCGACAGELSKVSACASAPAARQEIEPAEGVLVSKAPSSLTGRRRGRDLARRVERYGLPYGRGEASVRSARPSPPVARQRASEVRTAGEASSAEGRGRSGSRRRSQVPQGHRKKTTTFMLRRVETGRSWHG